MKKSSALLSIGALVLVAILMMLAAGCGSEETTTSTTAAVGPTTTAAAPSTTAATAPAETTTTAAAGPVSGGTLQLIGATLPQDVGYWPKTGPYDEAWLYPGVESLMKRVQTAEGQKQVPYLAESVTEDPAALTITFKLHQGVKFHDGSELTSDVVKWMYDIGKESGKLEFTDALKEFEIVDKYTFVLHLNYWNSILITGYGMTPMYSKEAFDKNGEEWCMNNCVGTGPYILKEFNRDQSLVWERNPNWWAGTPLLDGIVHRLVVDPSTAAAMMEAGEADIWTDMDAQAMSDMAAKGFTVQTGWAGFDWDLMPNTKDATSPMNDLRVREAVEYALDKPALCKALGFGYYTPMYEVAPEGAWGAGASGIKRDYDPAKAKQLLADAGYANGCPIDLLAIAEAGGSNAAAEAMASYLDAAGFQTNLDIADPGRFYGSVFGTGWKDLVYMFSGGSMNYLMASFSWWSPNARSNLASFARPAEFAALFDQALNASTVDEQKEWTGKIVTMMAQQELMVPVLHVPKAIILQEWVHTDYPIEAGFMGWSWGTTTWMDEH